MTMSFARPDIAPEGPAVPNVLSSTVALLQQIVDELHALRPLAQTPTAGTFVLSPDAINTPNGRRALMGHTRFRLSRIVIIYSGAINFVIKQSSNNWLTLPTTQAGITGILDLPVEDVIERGDSLQITADQATWAAYCIGYGE